MVSSQLDAFLESMAGECDEKALRAIKANEIFYTVCTCTCVHMYKYTWCTCVCIMHTCICILNSLFYLRVACQS